MARQRTVKPEFFKDRRIAEAGPITALVYQALWCAADDSGVARAEPDLLHGEWFARWPMIDVGAVRSSLWTLTESSRITLVACGDELYARINSWDRHQQINRPSQFRYLNGKQAHRDLSTAEAQGVLTEGSPSSPSPAPSPVLETTTTALVGLKPNGKQVARRFEDIKAHLSGVLEAVAKGERQRFTAEEIRTAQAELVFAYWQAKCGHERALLDDKRLTRLKRCLQENGGNVHELLYAVDGWAKDPTFKRLKDEGRELDGIQNIFTDRERIERLAGHCKGHRQQEPHPMAVKYLEGADVSAHQHESPSGGV